MDIPLENLQILQKSINKLKKQNEKLKKDLEILKIIKKKLTIETGYYDSCIEYEYVAYNGERLNIEDKHEFKKVKEWLENDK